MKSTSGFAAQIQRTVPLLRSVLSTLDSSIGFAHSTEPGLARLFIKYQGLWITFDFQNLLTIAQKALKGYVGVLRVSTVISIWITGWLFCHILYSIKCTIQLMNGIKLLTAVELYSGK